MKNKKIQALDLILIRNLLEKMFVGIIDYHPLPWSVVGDWTIEVVDVNQKTIIKIHDQNKVEAETLVELANSFNESHQHEQTSSKESETLPKDYNIEEFGATFGKGY